MKDRYDLNRAHPDTVRKLVQWILDGSAGSNVHGLTGELRRECRIPEPRTRAQRDRVIVEYLEACRRSSSGLPDVPGWPLFRAHLEKLLDEPTAVEGPFTCGECGRENEDHRAICSRCGAHRPTEGSPSSGTAPRGAGARTPAEPEPVPAKAAEEPVPAGGGSRELPIRCSKCQAQVTAGEAEEHWATCDVPEADPEPCGCEETDALKARCAALESRNFDLALQLSRIRKLARSPDVEALFQEVDREP